jgi:rhodanese-related sulfurtransferase
MKNTHVIDVRNKEEYDIEHISGAKSIPVSEIGRHSEWGKDDHILIVCNRGGQRSHKASEILKEKGYENVEILEGGMVSWKEGKADV